jgi:hypothetical protein
LPIALLAVTACGQGTSPGTAPLLDGGLDAVAEAPATVDVAPPRPVGPVSVSFATSRRPTFRWQLAAGSDGARVQVCADRGCARVLTSFDAAGDRGAPLDDLSPGVAFWRLLGMASGQAGQRTSATWELVVPTQSAPVAAVWGAMLDANGDGLGDIAVGDSDPFTPTQHVFVHHGGPQGPSAAPSSVLSASAPVKRYATSIASAGDLDGDGFTELLVGSPAEDTVYVYRGGPSGFADPPAKLVGPGGSGFGWAVSGAGDVDGDGYADVVVGLPLQPPVAGSKVTGGAVVYFGGADGLSPARASALAPRAGSDALGCATFVSTAGDIDGDGLADVAVWAGVDTSDPQYVYLYLGRDRAAWTAPSVLLRFEGASATWIGDANLLACAGDTNGDGYPDLVVSSCVPPNVGFEADHVSIFFGGPAGPPLVPSRRLVTPLAAGDHFALSLAALDADQDGLTDLAVSTISYASPPPSALVFAGGAAGPSLASTVNAHGTTTLLEREVGSSGDVDGDGYPDLVVADPSRATPLGDGGAAGSDGGMLALHGAVEIHRGGPGGVEPAARWTLLPPDGAAVAYGASLVRP